MLLFLDIDGVMAPLKSWAPAHLLNDGFPAFSTKAVNAVKKILTKNESVHVLLTTSHKDSYNIEQWLRIFKTRGLEFNHLDKLQNNTGNLSRKDEILHWIFTNNVSPTEKMMIIDDDTSLHDLPSNLKKSWVSTKPMIGLTEELIP